MIEKSYEKIEAIESEKHNEMVQFFKALGEETRLRIVRHLLFHGYCAGDFKSMIGKDQTTLSRHLKILVEGGILRYTQVGRNRIYQIKDDQVKIRLEKLGLSPIVTCCEECNGHSIAHQE